MRLRTWVRRKGRGAMWRLARATGLSYPTVHRIARDKQVPRVDTARLISRATRGEVTIADLMLPAR